MPEDARQSTCPIVNLPGVLAFGGGTPPASLKIIRPRGVFTDNNSEVFCDAALADNGVVQAAAVDYCPESSPTPAH